MTTRFFQRHKITVASITLIVILAVALVVYASSIDGYPVRHVDLNDGGIWVTSSADQLFGRLNKPAGSIDAALTPVAADGSVESTLDVRQAGAAVVAWDQGLGKLYPIDWASLQAGRPPYDPNGRNIFQYGQLPPPPPPVLTAAEQAAIRKAQEDAAKERARQEELMRTQQALAAKAAQEAAERQAVIQANTPPPPPPKPQPPAITYKFIGYFGPAKQKVAVLYDGVDQIFVRQGDELPKGVKVLEIGYESIKFGFTDPQFRDESTTLPMSSSY